MEFHRPRRSRPIINMTNMVDVMMLLLIFFILSTTFVHRPAIKLDMPPATHSAVVQTGKTLVTIGQDERLYLDGSEMALPDLEKKLTELAGTDKDKQVVVEADRHVSYGTVVATIDAIRGAGISRVTLPTLKPAAGRSSP